MGEAAAAAAVVVDTKCGKLKGTLERSFEGYDYCSFKGIPYAKAPVGELRFQDPIPMEPWSEVREATKFGSECAQMDLASLTIKGTDDCLYLNVYVKSIKPEIKLPVMVWIHGGGFIAGSGDDLLYGPDYLLRKDIVFITINYRLGVLGFLNFDDEVAPGNQGLKDQVMALQWVKENIANFGGDPNNVTIFGESAGGASVHYLTLSPLAKGLFHKAISQSGVSCNPWACSAPPENAYKLCELLGHSSKDPKKLVKFLQTITCERLIEVQEQIQKSTLQFLDIMSFGPGMDPKSKTPFLTVPVLEAMENGSHVPYILGCNTREGIFHLSGLKEKHYDLLNNDFDKCMGPGAQQLLQKNKITPSQLKNLYFGGEKISEENSDKIADLFGDFSFVEGIHRVVKCQVKQSSAPTYFYRFTYDKEFSFVKTMCHADVSGTAHFDECRFLFGMRINDMFEIEHPPRGSASYRVMEEMIELWVNFATFGQPTPDISDLIPTYWLPVADEKMFRTLNINENLRMENTINLEEQYSFGKFMKNKL